MRITTSADKYERALIARIQQIIDKNAADIVAGVPVDVYKERCAYIRALRDLMQELPKVMDKARE
jgi:hypothetical protein